MTFIRHCSRRSWLAAGGVAAAAVMLALVPFNMGGCVSDAYNSLPPSVRGKAPANAPEVISASEKIAASSLLDERDEPAMGQSFAVAVVHKEGLDNDEALNKYVNLVGLTVANATSRADSGFVFGVLDSNDVNAFAGPGGYVMITRGAVLQCQDESELAGVLAHEIAHVVNQHGLKAVKQAGQLEGLKDLAGATNANAAKWGAATDTLVDTVLIKGYSRDQEGEADLAAVDFLVGAGYDPHGYQRFLSRMAAANTGADGAQRLMSTHPGLGERASSVAAKIQERGNPGGATMADRFRQNVP